MAREEWWSAPTEAENGKLIIVTGRDLLDKEIASGKYIYRVEVSWAYTSEADGMPDRASAEKLEEITDALSETLKKNKGVLLTGIYTGDGKREWIFYVKSLSLFSTLFNSALSSLPLLPFDIQAFSDPEWEEYREMRGLTYISPEE